MLVNVDVNVAQDTVLYLHSIFRAIRRVEDAADIKTSPVRVCSSDFFSYSPGLHYQTILSTAKVFFPFSFSNSRSCTSWRTSDSLL